MQISFYLSLLLQTQGVTDDTWFRAIDRRSRMADPALCAATKTNLQSSGSWSLRADVQSIGSESVLTSGLG